MTRWILIAAGVLLAPVAWGSESSAPFVFAEAKTMTAGEVRKVDKEQGKVTIHHEPLANLDMPAMTMVFRVKDPSMLEQVKEGDRIQFVAERVEGNLTVVEWQPAR